MELLVSAGATLSEVALAAGARGGGVCVSVFADRHADCVSFNGAGGGFPPRDLTLHWYRILCRMTRFGFRAESLIVRWRGGDRFGIWNPRPWLWTGGFSGQSSVSAVGLLPLILPGIITAFPF